MMGLCICLCVCVCGCLYIEVYDTIHDGLTIFPLLGLIRHSYCMISLFIFNHASESQWDVIWLGFISSFMCHTTLMSRDTLMYSTRGRACRILPPHMLFPSGSWFDIWPPTAVSWAEQGSPVGSEGLISSPCHTPCSLYTVSSSLLHYPVHCDPSDRYKVLADWPPRKSSPAAWCLRWTHIGCVDYGVYGSGVFVLGVCFGCHASCVDSRVYIQHRFDVFNLWSIDCLWSADCFS